MSCSASLRLLVSAVALSLLPGCGDAPLKPAAPTMSADSYPLYPDEIIFNDSVESNSATAGGLDQLTFVDVHGEAVEIKNLLGEKNLVVVVTRGNTDPICPYCSTQTSRLISNYSEFSKRNAEVIVVYPVEKQADSKKLDAFLAVTRKRLADPESEVPFPILLDVELKSVEQLGIRGELSKPATYIIDTKGQVRFAYVGSTIADRPSIKALLDQLDAIAGEAVDKAPETPE